MIYCASYDKLKDIAELYREWTNRPTGWSQVPWNTFFVVAVDSSIKRIVGATQYILVDDPFFGRRFALVENVFVKAEYREQGVGKMLMEFTEWQCKLFGCEFLKLTTRKAEGKALYRSLEYEEGSSFYKRF